MATQTNLIVNPERVMEVLTEVEEQTNCIFSPEEAVETIQYAIRKCELNGKDSEYFYILLRDELEQYLMRAYINMWGEENRRRKLENVRNMPQ